MEELAVLMPYTSPYYIDYCNIPRIESRAAFNVNNAVSYATKYAYSYNYSYEVFLNGDCTNFASQIARAGGISNKSGWYYHGVNNSSKSWRVADTFVKYWKVSYSTTSFNTLSKKVAKGNFIAYDSNSDGKWNHVAFVTDTRSGTTSAGYRDLRIAQHTKNYNAWVSSETNGWENVSGLKAIVVTPN